jgi:primosomal protein N' (replication factor Y)
MKLVEVIFDIPVGRSFYYLCKNDINKFVRVSAPLGDRKRKGFVINVMDILEKKTEYKFIEKIYDINPLITDEILEFSKIISKRYYVSLGQVIFSIIGNLPLKYEKNFCEKETPFFTFHEFKKEIYLFSDELKKLNFYLDLISQEKGSLLFLFPEVSILKDYYEYFKRNTERKVLKYYGEMDKRERINNYLEILNSNNLIITGTRISVFLPLKDLSMIIIDSYTNNSYNEKKMPKYNAVVVAEDRCKFQNIPIILTSNFLSVFDYIEVKNKKINLIDRRNFEGIPEIFILDKRWEQMDKKLNFLTKFSVSMLEETILKGKKVGIIHNRKGSSKTFKCFKCGHVLRCKKCETELILTEENKLYCRYCRFYENFMNKCPYCGSKEIIERIIGIEKIYKELKSIYPDFKIQKFTAEEKIIEKGIDIFVGTSAIKNILDKFNFGLVIFPHADSFLNIPEYNSEEIFFYAVNEFLWKLKNKDAKIIIQTKNPNFELFTSLKIKNYELYYEKEIKTRQIVGYPPFSDIIVFEIPVKKSSTFENRVNLLKEIIENSNSETIFSDIISDRKNKRKLLKIVLKSDTERRPDYKRIMDLKEKLDFRIEINPSVF